MAAMATSVAGRASPIFRHMPLRRAPLSSIQALKGLSARIVPAEMAVRGVGKLVLDASAVVRIIEGSPQAAAMGEALAAADLVLAPGLMLTEVANALWRLQRSHPCRPRPSP